MPESKDANWKWVDFKDTVNSELVGNVGNFIHRSLSFYNNKLESKNPTSLKLRGTLLASLFHKKSMEKFGLSSLLKRAIA